VKILLADDDASLRRVIQFKLEKEGYTVVPVADGIQALDRLRDGSFDLLLSDIKMPGMDGIKLLEHARKLRPDLTIVLITAHATVAQAVQAVKLGAFDYITKPFEDDQLYLAIEKAQEFRKLRDENRQLKGKLKQAEQTGKLVGVSKPFKELMSLISRISDTDATVLISGQSGTGKELVARTIHARSSRAEKPFVAVNCAAIPRELIESELFGHVKGSFTGAVRDKRGKFELADEGTLFLDEIGELAIELQAKLLRALQERVVEPVGSEKVRPIDVRVIGATNVDLRQRMTEGRFRDDLYYRLNVIPIRVPSLAERREDIRVFVKEFVRRSAPHTSLTVSPELLRKLAEYDWPGNIRELENLIERMVILRSSDALTVDDLPADFGQNSTDQASSSPADGSATGQHLTFREAEENIVREALAACGGNRTKAAQYLNIPRHVLIYRMKKYGITTE